MCFFFRIQYNLVIVILEDPSTTHLQCSFFWEGDSRPRFYKTWPLNTVKLSCTHCSVKTVPKYNVSNPALDCGDVVLWVLLFLQSKRAQFWFHLTMALCSESFRSHLESHTGLQICPLEHQDLEGVSRFQSIMVQCVINAVLGDCGLNSFLIINTLSLQDLLCL